MADGSWLTDLCTPDENRAHAGLLQNAKPEEGLLVRRLPLPLLLPLPGSALSSRAAMARIPCRSDSHAE